MDILEEFKLMEKSFEVILIVSKIMNEEIQNKNKLEIIYDNIYNLLFKNLSNELDKISFCSLYNSKIK